MVKKISIGVVCEGPTDYAVLECLLPSLIAKNGLEIDFVRVQPDDDSTSGGVNGGWTAIYKWCIRYSGDRKSIFIKGTESGLFDQLSKKTTCDFVIVLMDSDTSETIQEVGVNHNIGAFAKISIATARERGEFIKSVISHWLSIEGCAAKIREKFVEGACVECIETWLVAACLEDARDPEELRLAEIEGEFLRFCLIAEGRDILGAKRMSRKSAHRYQKFAKSIADRVENSQRRCFHLNDLIERISRLI